jgi:amidase
MLKSLLAATAACALGACATINPLDGPADYAARGVIAGDLTAITAALASGEVSSSNLTETYIERIKAIDWSGPQLQSVLLINPDALEQARASDARRAAGKAIGPLDGAPILLKDNIETKDPMPTTAGSLALKDNLTGRDSPLVAGLRAAGAVILGKTNLSQWANFRSHSSMSGWSAIGGQVKNPHMLDRNPCGSSSGSGSAMAASLAAATVGTETNGSISCPSTVSSLVGFKPTVGVVSQQYIVPISSSQDTAGPMTKSVSDAALMMNAMDPSEVDYTAGLSRDALKGVRIGIARFEEGSHPPLKALFEQALADLKSAGAELVEIEKFETPDGFQDAALKVLEYEYKAGLDAYLADASPAVTARSLADVIAFNKAAARELSLFDQSIMEESIALGGLDSEDYLAARDLVQKATRSDGIDAMLEQHNVIAIVSPSGPLPPRIDAVNGDTWPQFPGAGWIAAIAGYPHVTVPMGAVRALPAGLSFIGAKGDDARILSLGYAYEQASKRRVEPRFLRSQDDVPEIAAAMERL